MAVRRGRGFVASPLWFFEQYRSLIRATHTNDELDAVRLLEGFMLARTTVGQADVREMASITKPNVRCRDDRVGYLADPDRNAYLNPKPEEDAMPGTKPNSGTPKDKRIKGNGGKRPGPKPGSGKK